MEVVINIIGNSVSFLSPVYLVLGSFFFNLQVLLGYICIFFTLKFIFIIIYWFYIQ